MKILHNPRCSKSRQALAILNENNINPEIVLYLKDTPSETDFKIILQKLNMKPQELLRKNEAFFKENFKGLEFNDDEWIKVMIENPKLIERPIVIRGNKAIVARPPESVKDLL